MKNNLDVFALALSRKHKFKIGKKIYEAFYYNTGSQRNVIYSIIYNGLKCVLKVYKDPRFTDEPISLKSFNKSNKSKILKAPKLYKYGVISPNEGWLIMEKLPQKGEFLKSPLNANDRKIFLNIFLEYKKYFPQKPTRKLSLIEKMPADKFHIYRINKWLELAANAEMRNRKFALDFKIFYPLFEKSLKTIEEIFRKKPMTWIHGHFKPQEIFKVSASQYYLTDFAHTKLYPEGHELGFMIWADHLMAGDWKLPYARWVKSIYSWIEDLKPVAKKLKIKNYFTLIEANIIERVLGTILADISASQMRHEEKITRLNLLYKLLGDLT